MTLTEFLLARIAEDEAVAKAAMTVHCKQVENLGDGKWGRQYLKPIPADEVSRGVVAYIAPGPSSPGDSWTDVPGSEHFSRHDPARVLAECEAKRRIVEHAAAIDSLGGQIGDYTHGARGAARLACRELSAVYADHPDYRDEWKP